MSPSAKGNRRRVSGPVTAQELPWFAAPPESLIALGRLIGNLQLMSAFRVPLSVASHTEMQNVTTAASLLRGTLIEPGEILSLIGLIGPFTKSRGYNCDFGSVDAAHEAAADGVCKVSSALYNVAIKSGLTVVERHPHRVCVSYIGAGRDAELVAGRKDVRVRNEYDKPIVLWADVHAKELFVAVYGPYAAPSVLWHQQLLHLRKAPRQQKLNKLLPAGIRQIVSPGVDGKTVRTAVTLTFPSGPSVYKQLSVDVYAPLPVIVECGPPGD